MSEQYFEQKAMELGHALMIQGTPQQRRRVLMSALKEIAHDQRHACMSAYIEAVAQESPESIYGAITNAQPIPYGAQLRPVDDVPKDGQWVLVIDANRECAIIGQYSKKTDSIVSIKSWATWPADGIGGWLAVDELMLPEVKG